MSLVLFTCMVGLIIAPTNVSYLNSILSLIAVALGAGAAGTLNMWYESDLDALMTRTCLRPIPTGQVTKTHTSLEFYFQLDQFLYFIIHRIYVSIFVITNNMLLFFCLYRLLKRRTPQNIVIGGAAVLYLQ